MNNFFKFFTDTETTGFSPEEDQIISYSAVIEDQKSNNIEEYEKMVKLKANIMPTPKALLINNINPFSADFLAKATKERDLMDDLIRISLFGKVLLCAYNASFDEGMFSALFKRLGKDFSTYFPMIWDPLPTAKRLIGQGALVTPEINMGKKSYRTSKLEEVFKALGYDSSKFNAHSALDDTKMLQLVAHGVYFLAVNRPFGEINPIPEEYKQGDMFSIVFNHETDGVIIKHIKVIKNDFHKKLLQVCLMDGISEIIPYELVFDQFECSDQIIKILENVSDEVRPLSKPKKTPIVYDEDFLVAHNNDSIEELKELNEDEFKAIMDYNYSEKNSFCDNEIYGPEYKIQRREFTVDDVTVIIDPKGTYDVYLHGEQVLSSEKRTLMDKIIKDELEKKTNAKLAETMDYVTRFLDKNQSSMIYEKYECFFNGKYTISDITKKNKIILETESKEDFYQFIKKIIDDYYLEITRLQIKKIPSVKSFKIERHPLTILNDYNDLKAEVFQTSNKNHKEMMKDLLHYYKGLYPSVFKDVSLPTFQLNLSSFLKK